MAESPTEKSLPVPGVRRFKHRLKHGSVIELQDNSRWEIVPGHEVFTDHWTTEADITVVPGGYPDYPFDLINSLSGDRVPARYRGVASGPARWRMTEN
jgi:hypothetical protein